MDRQLGDNGVDFFKMIGGAEPKTWGVILLDTWRIQGGWMAHIVTDADFC